MAKKIEIQELPLWNKLQQKQIRLSFELEVTARCNNDCRHCYINLPANDRSARSKELSLHEIEIIADQAAELGAIWCTITGGEPLLRPDFSDIYLALKQKGFLLTVFTNACLINDNIIQLFKRYPPRDLEITVYGVTKKTYESVTRTPGSFNAFICGLQLLDSNGIAYTLKAMTLKSNFHELESIREFCLERTKLPFRYDPLLHLRYDRDPVRNAEIIQERLSPDEVVALEMADRSRFQSMLKNCDHLIVPEKINFDECVACKELNTCVEYATFSKLFHCGIGVGEFSISYDGQLRLCSTLSAPGTTFDLRSGSLQDGLTRLFNNVRGMHTNSPRLLKTCKSCKIVNLCLWCPATAYLETGDMEGEMVFYCRVAHARAAALENERLKESSL